jgi:alpha-glucosidase
MNEPSNFCDYPCSDLNPATLEEGIVSAKPGVLLRRSADSHRQVIEGKRIFRRQNATGLKTGLAGRNLLDPLYKINNAAGVLSNKTANTDIVHKGGWAEYDTHNL